MKVIRTKFNGLILIKSKKFRDKRGYLTEILKENIIKKKFIFHILSKSKKNILRGLHLQIKDSQGKLVSIIKGKIFDVAVDLRKNSKTFLKAYKIILSEQNSTSIYIPPGFAHGFISLEKENIVLYSLTKYRNKKSEKTIKWNDKDLKIKWPNKKIIISKKDSKNISIKKFKEKFL